MRFTSRVEAWHLALALAMIPPVLCIGSFGLGAWIRNEWLIVHSLLSLFVAPLLLIPGIPLLAFDRRKIRQHSRADHKRQLLGNYLLQGLLVVNVVLIPLLLRQLIILTGVDPMGF